MCCRVFSGTLSDLWSWRFPNKVPLTTQPAALNFVRVGSCLVAAANHWQTESKHVTI